MDINTAIGFAQLIEAAYAVPPDDLSNRAGTTINPGGTSYTVVTTVYANDLATDMNPERGDRIVSIGFVLQAAGTGNLVVAIRGTQGILEWVQDVEFLQITFPYLVGAGHTEDGFTAVYGSLRTGEATDSPRVVDALATLPFKPPVGTLTICGHSLGGAVATLLALDVAANSSFKTPVAYTYASPRTGDPSFASTYDQVVPNTFRLANRLDLVPKLPLPPAYEHVLGLFDLNPVQLVPLPPKILVNPTIPCEHALNSYLHLLSVRSGGHVIPLGNDCKV
jgi:hypothetical protein